MESSELLILDTQTAGNKFSQECPVCSQSIVYMASVAYCQCQLHFHPKCFQQILNGKDLTEEPKIQCLYCRAEIQVEYRVEMIPNFNKDRCSLGNILLIVALALFLGTLATSIVVLLNLYDNEDELKAAVACLVIAVSFLGIGGTSFRLFFIFFMKKIVTVVSVRQLDRSLEFSAFKNIHDLEPESDHKLTPL